MNITCTVFRVGSFDQYAAGVTEKAKKALVTIGQMVQYQARLNMSGPLQKYGSAINVRGPIETTEGISVEVGVFADSMPVLGTGSKAVAMLAAHEGGSGLHAGRTYNGGGQMIGKYTIKPRNAKVLAFLWPGQVSVLSDNPMDHPGPMAYLKSVQHPGVRPQYFLTRAVRDNVEKFMVFWNWVVRP